MKARDAFGVSWNPVTARVRVDAPPDYVSFTIEGFWHAGHRDAAYRLAECVGVSDIDA